MNKSAPQQKRERRRKEREREGEGEGGRQEPRDWDWGLAGRQYLLKQPTKKLHNVREKRK